MEPTSGQRVNSTLVEIAFLGTIAFLAHQKILGETSVMTMLGIYATSRFGVGLVKRFVASDATASVQLPPSMPPSGGSGQSGGHRVTRGVIIESIPVSDDRFPPPLAPTPPQHRPPTEAPATVPRPGPRRDPRRDERSILAFLKRWALTPYAYVLLSIAAAAAILTMWSILGGVVTTIAHAR